MKIENNSEHAWLDPPVLGREEGQLGQQLRQHQDAGRLREADAGENTVRSPFHRLERTAAKKRGHEDDSEIEQAEVKIAPKKVKNDEKFNEGGGGTKPLKNQKLVKNSQPSKKKLPSTTGKPMKSYNKLSHARRQSNWGNLQQRYNNNNNRVGQQQQQH